MRINKPRLITVSAAGRTLGVSTTMIYRWISEGKLQEELVGGREKSGQFRLVTAASVDKLRLKRAG